MAHSKFIFIFILFVIQSALFAQASDSGSTATNTKEPPKVLYRPADQTPPQTQSAEQKNTVTGQTQNPTSEDYLQGKMDGERDAKGNGLWFLAGLPGLCCYGVGGLGVLGSFIWVPEPPVEQLMGKSTNYILGYTEGYKSKAKRKNMKSASLGCGIGTALSILGYYLFFQSLSLY
jgi:hypothetical protein